MFHEPNSIGTVLRNPKCVPHALVLHQQRIYRPDELATVCEFDHSHSVVHRHPGSSLPIRTADTIRSAFPYGQIT